MSWWQKQPLLVFLGRVRSLFWWFYCQPSKAEKNGFDIKFRNRLEMQFCPYFAEWFSSLCDCWVMVGTALLLTGYHGNWALRENVHLLSNCVPRVWINSTWTCPSHLWCTHSDKHKHTHTHTHTHTHSYMLSQAAEDITNGLKHVGGHFN